MSILNLTESFALDNSIESFEYHSYKPYVTSFNFNDEIRIPINQQDLYVLPSASTLYIEGTITAFNRETKQEVKSVLFTNNPILHLFQDIRYELNGIEIDKIKNVGVTTTMKSLVSMNELEASMSKLWGWDIAGTKISHGSFSVSIPLNKILGFAEDYNKIIINCKHELILLRSNTNLNSVKLNTNEYIDNITISKIVWRMPHIKVSDRERLSLLKCLERDRAIQIAFRNWDLYEYPLLPETSKHSWAIKTSSQIEKPRYIIIGLKTARKNDADKDITHFDHCNLRDVKVFLNSSYFPYESFDVSFSSEKFPILYEQYAKFQQSYYNRAQGPLLSPQDFKKIAPLFVIDCSRQNETLKTGSVDVRVEFECESTIPPQTSAYCLILNDSIVEYKPLSNITKKIS
jgi:hypothetical protein